MVGVSGSGCQNQQIYVSVGSEMQTVVVVGGLTPDKVQTRQAWSSWGLDPASRYQREVSTRGKICIQH